MVTQEKFNSMMEAYKSRYPDYPENVIVKGAMAFTARMFITYPDLAKEYWENLPKATQDESN